MSLRARINITSLSVENCYCKECYGGLISILSVYNKEPEEEMIWIKDLSCQDSISGYYGCFYATARDIVDPSPDDELLSIAF